MTPTPQEDPMRCVAHTLREQTPATSELHARLSLALDQAQRQEQLEQRRALSAGLGRWQPQLALTTVLLIGSTSLWLAQHVPLAHDASPSTVHHHELELEHPGHQMIWIELPSTATPSPSTLHVQAPQGLSLQRGDQGPTVSCDQPQCAHALEHHEDAPLRVGVPSQGQWSLTLSHDALGQRVHQRITLQARPARR